MCKKRKYDELGAKLALSTIRCSKKVRGEIRFYYCYYCKSYHLTSQNKKL